jgi:hypothetical protein
MMFSRMVSLGSLVLLLGWHHGALAETLPLPKERALGPNDKMSLTFLAAEPAAKAIKIVLGDADFSGATILVWVNDRQMTPYHAFGGDTRYDNVKGKPGMNPPIAPDRGELCAGGRLDQNKAPTN